MATGGAPEGRGRDLTSRAIAARRAPDPPAANLDDFPLFRARDPETSVEAGAVIEPHLGKIQTKVLAVFQWHGPMTARRAEQLACFSDSQVQEGVQTPVHFTVREGRHR